MAVFVDTSALYALLDAQDRFQTDAARIWASLRAGQDDLVTTNYVILEVTTLAHRRLGFEAARAVHDGLVPVLSVQWITESLHRLAVSAFHVGGQRNLSLVDCVSFEVMRAWGIKRAFAFDADFTTNGFELLP